jgi:hypothetical protein
VDPAPEANWRNNPNSGFRGYQAFLVDDFFDRVVVFLVEDFFDTLLAFLAAKDLPLTPFFFDFSSLALTEAGTTLLTGL